MTEALRRQLETKRKAAIQEAAERLAANGAEDIGDQLKRIDAYGKLLAVMPRSETRQRLTAVVIGLICVTAVGLAWTLRIPESKIILNVQSEAIALKLVEPWSWSEDMSIDPELFRLEQLTSVELPAESSEAKRLEGGAWAEVKGDQATLVRLGLDAKGTLSVESGKNGDVALFSRGAALTGEFTVSGKCEAVVRRGRSGRDHQIPIRTAVSRVHLVPRGWPEPHSRGAAISAEGRLRA